MPAIYAKMAEMRAKGATFANIGAHYEELERKEPSQKEAKNEKHKRSKDERRHKKAR